MEATREARHDGPGDQPVLSVRDVNVTFRSSRGAVRAVNGVSWDLRPGEVLGIVGESGSGKSAMALSILGLLPKPPRCRVSGSAMYRGTELLGASERRLREIRGNRISMIFQDPMSSLNPLHVVGKQISEAIGTHRPDVTSARRWERAVQLLKDVGIPDPERRAEQHPHEYSGGMRQRAMIAMAMANNPQVLIADEPTTALDVTIQAQVVELLRRIRQETGTAMVLITHDLGLVAEIADRVVVMYGGRIVEHGPVLRIFEQPSHPYTVGLLRSMPKLEQAPAELPSIPGQPPDPAQLPEGCSFHPRCPLAKGRRECLTVLPPLEPLAGGGASACHFYSEVPGAAATLFGGTEDDSGRPAGG